MQESTSIKSFKLLCGLYIISLDFQFVLPYSFQIPEIVFVLLFGNFLLIKYPFKKIRLQSIDWAIIILLLSILISALAKNEKSCYLDFAKIFYLFLVYLVFRSLRLFSAQNILVEISKYFTLCGVFASIIAIMGVVLHFGGIQNTLTDVYYDFPYTGTLVRALGYTTSPSMLMSLLCLCILLQVIYFIPSAKNYIFLSLMLLAAFLTFSKGFLLLLFGIFIFLLFKKSFTKTKKIIFGFSFVLMTTIYLLATHFIVKNTMLYARTIFSGESAVYTGSKKTIYPSTYFTLKKVALNIGAENLLVGCGPGKFKSELKKLQAQNNYPANLPIYEPHSTPFGSFAETGLVGICGLAAFVLLTLKDLKKYLISFDSKTKIFLISISSIILIESFSTDLLHFRMYWIVLAIFASLCTKNLSKEKTF